MGPVLVTGASGNVGRAVVTALNARGIPVRVGARRGGDVRFDFADRSTFHSAVEGCRGVFLLRPPAISDTAQTLVPLIDEARRAGAEHVVFLSVAGAESNSLVPHHRVERHLVERPGRYTILRPGFFAQNLGDAYRDDIRDRARVYVPAGRGRVAFVDVRDVGEVAALAFASPEAHHRVGYTLTGPEAIAFDDVARILQEALGHPIRYQPASILGYAHHLRRLPAMQIVVQTILHVGLRFGQAEKVDETLERLLGRPGRTLRDYVHDHVDLWR